MLDSYLDNYDEQLRIRFAVADFDAYVQRYRVASLATRRRWPHVECAYGPSELERLDVFMPPEKGAGRALHVFLHGGYWRAFDKDDYSFVSEPTLGDGNVAVVANYGLMPAVTMAQIVAQCRCLIRWVYAHAALFGADANRIVLSGHSAGGHLAALLHLTRWTEYGLPADVIKATSAVSGLFDLEPVLRSFLKQETGLTADDAAQFSPISWPERGDPSGSPLLLTVGSDETAEFQRQTAAFSSALHAHGFKVEVQTIPRRNHMSVVVDIGEASSLIARKISAQTAALEFARQKALRSA